MEESRVEKGLGWVCCKIVNEQHRVPRTLGPARPGYECLPTSLPSTQIPEKKKSKPQPLHILETPRLARSALQQLRDNRGRR